MTGTGAPAHWRDWARFAGVATLAAGALAAIGAWPTRRVGGPDAVEAMLAGCAASWLAGLAGAAAVVLAGASGQNRAMAALAATVVRLLLAAGAGLALALLGPFPRAPLLLWLGISYVALLPLEAWFALKSS